MYTYILLCKDSKDHHGLFLFGTEEDKQRWVFAVLLTAITAWRSGTIISINLRGYASLLYTPTKKNMRVGK